MIVRLSEEVVNRIAAGEVVHRPVSAVKEMLENSIDAGATSVTVAANSGGLKQLMITDNGKGIRKQDLGIVCERFTTSKLKTFEDLQGIGTYGFRGEALASISHVAKVSITSKTADEPCAYKASYMDGKMVAPRKGQKAEPRPCAGNLGTTISVQDMFFNMPSRRQSVNNASAEYGRILDVVSKYAVHCGLSEREKRENEQAVSKGEPRRLGVGMVCKKVGGAGLGGDGAQVHTRAESSKLDNIRAIFGAHVASELLEVQGSSTTNGEEGEPQELKMEDEEEDKDEQDGAKDDSDDQAPLEWAFEGYVSNANYNKKKSIYIFFINNRLVSCSTLKRAIESMYAEYLPKGTFPFVYLSIQLPPERLDVNVHPTKEEVRFLHEDAIVNRIVHGLRAKLAGANTSRVFYTQQTLHVGPSQSSQQQQGSDAPTTKGGPLMRSPATKRKTGDEMTLSSQKSVSSVTLTSASKAPYRPNKLVRTDPSVTGLESFFSKKRPRKSTSSQDSLGSTASSGGNPIVLFDDVADEEEDEASQDQEANDASRGLKGMITPETSFNDDICAEAISLTSVQELVHAFESRKSERLASMLSKIVLVGWVDERMCLVQVETGLYVMDVARTSCDLFYQQVLRNFGRFERIVLEDPLALEKVLEMGIKARKAMGIDEAPRDTRDGASRPRTPEAMTSFLIQRGGMLDEYFRIKIDPETRALLSLPEIIPGYVPDTAALPEFFMRLCEQVEWFDEKGCFSTMAEQLAAYYSQLPALPPEEVQAFNKNDDWKHDASDRRAVFKNKLLPAIKKRLCATVDHSDPKTGVLRQIASLESLYRIFERC